MRTLNDPVGWDEDSTSDGAWSPRRGFIKATIKGSVVALVLIILSAPLAAKLPTLVFHPWFRLPLAFCTAWVLFGVVQGAAGMVGRNVSALAAALTLLVLLSHHCVLAAWGAMAGQNGTSAWACLHPAVVVNWNLLPSVAILFCTWLRHDGGGNLQTLTDIANIRVWRFWWW